MAKATVQNALDAMDRNLKSVMPDSWHGHARLKIAERDFSSPKKREFAERLSARLLDGNDISAEKAAEIAIKKTEEKLG